MIILGDIGNTETKICLVNSNNKIIKQIILSTKLINLNLLQKSLITFAIKKKFQVYFKKL